MESEQKGNRNIRIGSNTFFLQIKRILRKRLFPIFRIEEFVAVTIFLVFSLVLLAVNDSTVSLYASMVSIVRYFSLAVPHVPVVNIVWLVLYVLLLIYIFRIIANYISLRYLNFIFSKPVIINEAFTNVIDLFRAIVVMLFVFVPSAALLGEINILLKYSVYDATLWNLDATFFGFQAFLVLPHVFQQAWISHMFWIFYFSLGYVIALIIIVLYIVSKKYLFRIAVLSFIFSTFLVFPSYILIPSIDPGNFFIRNLHHTVFSPEISNQVSAYSRSSLTSEYIETLQKGETDTRQGESVPVSCFPSLHAIWGILCVLLVTKYKKILFAPTCIWLVLMLLGGLYFAQHYLIDYLIALPFAILTYAFSVWLVRRDMQILVPDTDGRVTKRFE